MRRVRFDAARANSGGAFCRELIVFISKPAARVSIPPLSLSATHGGAADPLLHHACIHIEQVNRQSLIFFYNAAQKTMDSVTIAAVTSVSAPLVENACYQSRNATLHYILCELVHSICVYINTQG
jgi:hypothetical protein